MPISKNKFFDTLEWTEEDENLFEEVRLLGSKAKEWKTNYKAIRNIRERLLDLQNWRCAYCQAPIVADENGHRELDHILPKEGSKDAKVPLAQSGALVDRYHTFGYSRFRYEPKNLVVVCKQCNTYKSTFDPLANRASSCIKYPSGLTSFTWFHPHIHRYSDHIKISKNMLFSRVTRGGAYVIYACKLNESTTIENKFAVRAKTQARHAPKLRVAMFALSAGILSGTYGMEQAKEALVDIFKLKVGEADVLLRDWIAFANASNSRVSERAERALTALSGKLALRGVDASTAARALTKLVS
ncbi:HNH endonuclease [Paraburkholderia sp. EG285A]|uniref:HNH endonuclease n=1 Tax=Paraburkholderia sp. EG285A TaxID=3237009 RepID=UPI0034D2D65D